MKGCWYRTVALLPHSSSLWLATDQWYAPLLCVRCIIHESARALSTFNWKVADGLDNGEFFIASSGVIITAVCLWKIRRWKMKFSKWVIGGQCSCFPLALFCNPLYIFNWLEANMQNNKCISNCCVWAEPAIIISVVWTKFPSSRGIIMKLTCFALSKRGTKLSSECGFDCRFARSRII